ncbi:DUF4142 domain-containing protein [Streptomyces sp. SudanB25_2051]|uniref:DUF4142 domain-containing protein n=1 Tax=Streptomyces sp. SudanB25_2051 TaxID=3035275 RepID=UPI003F579DAD
MRKHLWAATALTCLSLSGIAAAPALAAEAPPTDYAFLRAAHQGNLTEIAAGKDAQKNATTECVKHVGGVLVRDHTKLDAATRALADKLGVDLPMAPSPEQQRTLAAVMAKAGTSAYDTAWLKAQDAAHTKTLGMIDHQIAKGKDAEVTAAAKAARPSSPTICPWSAAAPATSTPRPPRTPSTPATAVRSPSPTRAFPRSSPYPPWPSAGCSSRAAPSGRPGGSAATTSADAWPAPTG